MRKLTTTLGQFRRGFCLVGAALFVMCFSVVSAQAGHTDSASADATAKVIQPISMSVINDSLRFGTLVPTGIAGTVVIDPDGSARTATNVDTLSGPFSAAVFQVSGQTGESFLVSFPASFNISSGPNTMLVNIVTSYSIPPGTTANTLTFAGSPVVLSVGATLNVGANQPSGTYSDTFVVTVTYQ